MSRIRVARVRTRDGRHLPGSVVPWLFRCLTCGERDKAHTQQEALTDGIAHLRECAEREVPC